MEVVGDAKLPIVKLRGNAKTLIPEDIPEDNIILIRFIRSKRILNTTGKRFKGSEDLVDA